MSDVKTNKIVTISRRFGSGGLEIGRKLAERFAIPMYDKELVLATARDFGASPELVERLEQTATTGFWRLARGADSLVGGQFGAWSLEDSLYAAQSDAILRLAERGPCVFVGRCADVVLAGRPELFSIFLSASLDFRIERTIRIDGVAPDKARSYVRAMDRRRRNYYNERSEGKWGDAANYRLCVDVGAVGIEKTVDAISLILRDL